MKFKKIFLISLLALLLVFVGCKKTVPANDTITGESLDKIQEDNKEKENYLLIDVRSAEEYNEGHVKHAINIPLDELESRLAEIEDYKNKDIITICNTGNKSGQAQKILQDKGFTKVLNAQGVKEFNYTTITKAASVLGPKFDEMARTGEYTILDFREEKDYLEGHLPGAINTTEDEVLNILDQIPMDKPVLTYCYTGNRSFGGAHKLAEQGYNVTNAIDGTKEYDKYELVK